MNTETAVNSQRFQQPGNEVLKAKASSINHLLVFSSSVGRDGGRAQAQGDYSWNRRTGTC